MSTPGKHRRRCYEIPQLTLILTRRVVDVERDPRLSHVSGKDGDKYSLCFVESAPRNISRPDKTKGLVPAQTYEVEKAHSGYDFVSVMSSLRHKVFIDGLKYRCKMCGVI